MTTRTPTEKPLKHFLAYGVRIIGTYPGGATAGSWTDPGNFAADLNTIQQWWTANIRRFQFIPGDYGLIVIDIDRKNGKDGLKELYTLFTESPAPDYLLHPETHPAHTVTPSGGLHLYFTHTGSTNYRHGDIRPGLEIVHTRHLITVPGSYKDGKPYVFYGDLNDAPPVPFTLRKHFPKDTPQKPHRFSWEKTDFSDTPLATMAATIERQGNYAGRNEFCFQLAHWAAKTNTTAIQVIEYCQERFPDFPESEIRYTVHRQFYGGKL